MEKKNFESEIIRTKKERSSWRTIGLMLGFINVVLVFGILSVMGTERTIVVPAVTKKSFWLEDEVGSQEYLEQMGLFFTGLMVDVSPSNVDYQGNLLMKYTDPRSHGAIQAMVKAGSEKLKRENSSTTFYPIEIETHVKKQQVVVTGEETLLLGEKVVSKQVKAYRITFKMRQGRIYVTEFLEVDKNEPFKVVAGESGHRAGS